MDTVKLTKEQKDLLVEIESAGVAIEYLLSVKGKADVDDYLAHKQAALSVLEKVKKDTDDQIARSLLSDRYKNKKRSDFFQVEIDHDKLDGERISLQEFLGFYYDLEKQKCALRGQTSHLLNNVLNDNTQDSGYVYAFFDPPYTIRGSMEEKSGMFRDIEMLFFGKFDSQAQIWKWSDSCSNYFDSGNEWWGSYFYTYAPSDSEVILSIVASTTD